MKRLADQHNVVSKLSGLGTFLHRNDEGHIADVVGETVALFGAGSLPVRLELSDRETVDAATPIWSPPTARRWLGFDPEIQTKLLSGTARRVYRLVKSDVAAGGPRRYLSGQGENQ